MTSSYVVQDQSLLDINDDKTFHPNFTELLSSPPNSRKEQLLKNNVALGIFQLRVFSESWCSGLISELTRYQEFMKASSTPIQRPNSMNHYGVILDQLGFRQFFDEVVQMLLPITSLLFSKEGGDTLDDHHAFTVEYEHGGDTCLGFHVDDAEVTLNICLGEEFEGGDVYFRGQRCAAHVNTAPISDVQINPFLNECFDYKNIPGLGILHAGKNRHGVKPIDDGHRLNLILWCRSSEHRRLHICNSNSHNENGSYPFCSVCMLQPHDGSGAQSHWHNAYDN